MSEIPEQEDYSALPLEDRLTHKVWKVRLNAYEESTRAFTSSPDESASCFKPYNNDPDLLVKAVRDANVVAQEAGIGLLLAYLEFSGAHNAVRTRSSAVAAIVEKCLGSTRAGTKTKAIDVCLMYVELDTGEPVIEDLIPGLSNKLPKIVAATTMAMKKIYEAFGAKTVKAKPAVQVLPKLFTHADKNVRAEATELAIILYRWLGDAVKPMLLADLKPVQVKELETAFDSITIGEVKQERFLRSQQAAQASAGDDDSAAADSEVVEEEAVDAFDLAEPVDVLATLPPTFEDAMSSTKWKDRKELLEVLVSSSTVPRIKEGDYGDVARTLGKCVQKDANVVCVALAANCIENLAKGLKRSFGRYRNVIFSPCGERFKEKKQNVIDAISAALDALFLTTTLDDILEETLTLIKSKNPSVRQHMLAFLSRSLSVTPVFPKKEEVKALAEGAASLVGDADVKVREAALETLGVLMKLIGERAMGPYLEGLDDIKKAKIMEYFTSATVKAKAEKIKAVAAPVVKPAVKKAPVMKKAPIGTIPNSPTKKKPVVGSGYGVTRPSLAKPTSRLTRPSEAARPESPAPASRTIRAGVTLARPTAQNLARPTTHSTSTEGNMSAADRMDLESLRREKKDWLATAVDREDLARMRQQIQELQIKNAGLIEASTKESMHAKTKDAMLDKAQRDVEQARLQMHRYEREIESLKSQLTKARLIQDNYSVVESPSMSQRSASPRKSPPLSSSQTTSRISTYRGATEEKENRYTSLPKASTSSLATTAGHRPMSSADLGPMSPGSGGGGDRGTQLSGAASGVQNWKNAADLTARLRERIESMKKASSSTIS